MKKEIILGKLTPFLARSSLFGEECEVIYFLVEIRKLIEDAGKENFKTLYFYCCWVAHVRLSYNSAVEFLTGKFDDLIDMKKQKKEIQKDLINGQQDFFKLKDFKSELSVCLSDSGLPTAFLNCSLWYKFCQLFLENILECEIDISQNNNSVHKINKLAVEKSGKDYCYKFTLSNDVKIPGIILKYKNHPS